MKILYVTTAWTGLRDILYNGSKEAKGMPAFIRPLKRLILEGNDVDIVLVHDMKEIPQYNINIDWLSYRQIIGEVYWEPKISKKYKSIIKLYRKLDKILRENKYDFVYGHGVSADVARIISDKYKVPFGQRLYGTFLNDYIIKHGLLKAKIIHFLEYKAFKSKKKFLLVTEDGSKGEEAYEKINKGKSPSEFYFWINGIEHMPKLNKEDINFKFRELGGENFLFYVARIDRWKKQEDSIKILKILKDKGYNLKLFIAGQTGNKEYLNELTSLVEELGVKDEVVFMGPISRDEINLMCKLAKASFSLYDICNLGNVFHEMLSAGAVILSKNDGSLDKFIVNGENGFLINNVEEGAENIIKILNNKEYEKTIRENAINTSVQKMRTWDERVDDEIKLIKKYSNTVIEV